jgi:hypothetical protein
MAEPHSGWLVKEGGFFRTWLRRWFVLDPKARVLNYYVDNQASTVATAPKGFIEVSFFEC